MKRLVVLSGPSCVGKGPLRAALKRQREKLGIKYGEIILCNSRKPRLKQRSGPFEVNAYEVHGLDYYFLPRGLFGQLDPNRFIVGDVRDDVQAIDLEQVREVFQKHDLILAEVFHTLGRGLMHWLRSQTKADFDVRSVFLMPLSDAEVLARASAEGISSEEVVYQTMRAKLERRGEDDTDAIKKRAKTAYLEMLDAPTYTDTIVNHAGEDDREQWGDALGVEAQKVFDQFLAVLR